MTTIRVGAAGNRTAAAFQCDGKDDHVEINAALQRAAAGDTVSLSQELFRRPELGVRVPY